MSSHNDVDLSRQWFPLSILAKRPNYHWFVVSTVCIGAFMAALDASIVSIALPAMQKTFQVSMPAIEWISLIYLLTLAATIVPLGRLSDMVGRRFMYTSGFAIFVVGSVLCALSHDITQILAFRIVQGLGAAFLQANSVSLITAATPARDRGKAIGIQASAQGLGLSVGPFLGGVLIANAGWHSIFEINVPIGIVGTLVGLFVLPKTTFTKKARQHFDLMGAVTLAIALVSLMYVLKEGATASRHTPWMPIVSLCFVIVFVPIFIWLERRLKEPLVNLRYLAKRLVWVGNLTGVLSFAVMYTVTLLGPFLLIQERGFSSVTAGLYLCLIPLGMAMCTPIAGVLADKIGRDSLTMAGMGISGLGTLFIALFPLSIPMFALGAFCVGAGLGTFTPANNATVMDATEHEHLGVAGSILNMSRTIGMGLGVTIGGVSHQLFLNFFGPRRAVEAFRGAFLVDAGLAFLTIVILYLCGSIRHHRD